MSSAVGALSGPLHGGAPTRVLQMLDEVERAATPSAYVRDMLDRGERIMGFGHRVYRAEDPRARVLRRTARKLGSKRVEVAEALEEAALTALREKSPDRVLETNVEFWAAVVLEIADIPPPMYPPMFGCARVAGWSAHIIEQRRTGRLIRPSARYVGPPSHPAAETVSHATLAEAAAAGERDSPRQGDERELAELRAEWGEELELRRALVRLPRARRRLPRDRPVPLPSEDGADPPRPRGREPGVPRLGAPLARAALARPSRAT